MRVTWQKTVMTIGVGVVAGMTAIQAAPARDTLLLMTSKLERLTVFKVDGCVWAVSGLGGLGGGAHGVR